MRFIRFHRLALAIAPFIAACNEDNELGLGPGNGTRYSAALAGANVRPTPVGTSAAASATVTVRGPDIGTTESSLSFAINTVGITSATAAHIHLGGAAIANGQLLATLFTNPTDTAITTAQLVSGSLAPSGVAISLDSLTTLMKNGAAYVDIHSTANQAGLVRGQLVPSGEVAPGEMFAARPLTGAKERPTPVVSTATGTATFTVQPGGVVRFALTVASITGVAMAHIHTGVADSAGPIAVSLFSSTTPTGAITGTLANGVFTAGNIEIPGVTLDSLLTLMRRGRTYVNVHTRLNPDGEIRAQVEPVSILP